ncbi:MAG: DUF167 domain-containing protein [Microbacterium sp.]
MMRVVSVRVKAGSRRDPGITEDAEGVLVVTVREQAVDGKANAAVSALLAAHFGVPRRDVELISGHTSRLKRFRIG